MSNDPVKTTVYLPEGAYRRIKALAESEGTSAASLIREAVLEYAARRAASSRPRSIGALRTGKTDLSERTDELLDGFGS